jgi:hypothetical protein
MGGEPRASHSVEEATQARTLRCAIYTRKSIRFDDDAHHACRRLIRHLQVDLRRTDKIQISRLVINGHADSLQRSWEVAKLPSAGIAESLVGRLLLHLLLPSRRPIRLHALGLCLARSRRPSRFALLKQRLANARRIVE